MQYYSPLRYPGGKTKMADYIKLILSENYLVDGNYIEPYAGGASVALNLIINEYISTAYINDIDILIYAFWHSVLKDTDSLCEKIIDTKVDISEWKKQKHVQSNKNDYSLLEIGFSTFFLNRTNRSGILNAGVIGGQNQTGEWKMDSRYNKKDLIERIQMIAKYENRIKFSNLDAIEFIQQVQKSTSKKTLIYLDPPYYNKGKQLYINFYNHQDHLEIAQIIKSVKKGNWIISYDNHPAIRELYSQYRQKVYSLSYSAGGPSVGSEVIIYDDKLKIPTIENPTNKREIKKYYAQHYVYA